MATSAVGSVSGIMTLLQSACGAEMPLFGALASVDEEGSATARMMVLRGIDAGHLWMSTHAGSEKVDQLRSHPVAEVAVWLQEQRVQLRLRATWRVIDRTAAARNESWANRRQQAWREQSEETRRMFFWPTPGAKVKAPSKRALSGALSGEAPPTFAILLGALERIDALWLKKPVHQRYIHERMREQWRSSRIAP